MPLTTYVENLDSIDENLRDFYKPVEEGEGYVLNAEPANGYTIENVEALKLTLGKERSSRKEFEKKYTSLSKKYEGVDIDELASIKEKYDRLAELDPESEAARLAEERIKQAEEKVQSKLINKQKEWQKLHEKEVGTRESQINTLKGQLQKLMIDNAATSALAESGVLPEHLELLLPKVTNATRLFENEDGSLSVQVVDREGNPRVRSDGQDMTVKDLIPELQNKWPSSFSAETKRGGGIKPQHGAAGTKTMADMSPNEMILNGLKQFGR